MRINVRMTALELYFFERAAEATEARVAYSDLCVGADDNAKANREAAWKRINETDAAAESALRALRAAEAEAARADIRAECRSPKPIGVR